MFEGKVVLNSIPYCLAVADEVVERIVRRLFLEQPSPLLVRCQRALGDLHILSGVHDVVWVENGFDLFHEP